MSMALSSVPLTGLTGAITHPKGSVYRCDRNNFQPRIGLAWNFHPKMSVSRVVRRADAGPAAQRGIEEYIAQAVAQQAPGNPLPAFYLSQGPNLRIPYTILWSAGFQAQISPNWLVDMLYQGSAAVPLNGTVNINVLSKAIYDSKNLTFLNQVSSATQNYVPYTQFGSINETSNLGHKRIMRG
jgi:hypothetical protein